MKNRLRVFALALTLTASAAFGILAAAPALADVPTASVSAAAPTSVVNDQNANDASGAQSAAIPVTLTMIAGLFVLGGSIALVLASGNRRREGNHS